MQTLHYFSILQTIFNDLSSNRENKVNIFVSCSFIKKNNSMSIDLVETLEPAEPWLYWRYFLGERAHRGENRCSGKYRRMIDSCEVGGGELK